MDDGRLLWLFTPQCHHNKALKAESRYYYLKTRLGGNEVASAKKSTAYVLQIQTDRREKSLHKTFIVITMCEYLFQSLPWNSLSPALTYNRRHIWT